MALLGIITITHGLLEETIELLGGVDHTIHAGDIGMGCVRLSIIGTRRHA